MICKICNTEIKNYRLLRYHIEKSHGIKSQEYWDLCFGKHLCPECKKPTVFLDINRGYRTFCSLLCLNRNKAKKPLFLKILSDSLKGKPHKKHSIYTKNLISENSKLHWKNNREKLLKIFQSPDYRKKASEKTLSKGFVWTKGFIDGIRYDSNLEKSFIEICKENNWRIRRFGESMYGEPKSISLNASKTFWTLPDFVSSEALIEVKDFHPWFKKELFTGLTKYKEVNQWAQKNGYFYIFWFKDIEWVHLHELLNIKDENDLKNFITIKKSELLNKK